MGMLARWRSWREARRCRRGRILAVKWGYNPNSSSLGVDVTFLLLGVAAISLLTPLVALFVRSRRRRIEESAAVHDVDRAAAPRAGGTAG